MHCFFYYYCWFFCIKGWILRHPQVEHRTKQVGLSSVMINPPLCCSAAARSHIFLAFPLSRRASRPSIKTAQLYYSCCQYCNNKRTQRGEHHITLLTRTEQMHIEWILSFKTCQHVICGRVSTNIFQCHSSQHRAVTLAVSWDGGRQNTMIWPLMENRGNWHGGDEALFSLRVPYFCLGTLL